MARVPGAGPAVGAAPGKASPTPAAALVPYALLFAPALGAWCAHPASAAGAGFDAGRLIHPARQNLLN